MANMGLHQVHLMANRGYTGFYWWKTGGYTAFYWWQEVTLIYIGSQHGYTTFYWSSLELNCVLVDYSGLHCVL